MNTKFIEVVQHVHEYFKEHLPQYTVCEVRRQSYNTEDDYLYMVSAVKEDGSFATWTSWNESIQSLNWGHYDLPDMKTCAEIMSEYQNTHNTESSLLECLQELLIKRDDSFDDSYHQLLYATGFVDGISAQQENCWNNLSDKERNALYAEAVKE